MDIGVGSEAVIAVPQPHLNILHRIAQIQEDGRAGMPLRYNYDKPGKPCITNGFWDSAP